jgi:hypothetical protein
MSQREVRYMNFSVISNFHPSTKRGVIFAVSCHLIYFAQVQRLKDALRRSAKMSRLLEVRAPQGSLIALFCLAALTLLQPPETIDMSLIDPKLYAALRRQRPELPIVPNPNRAGDHVVAAPFICSLARISV